MSEALTSLLARAHAGDPDGALAEAAARTDEAARVHGADGPEHGAALVEESALLLELGEDERGRALLRRASQHTGDAPEHEQSRLSCLLRLGEALAVVGRHEEALSVHQEGLDRRRAAFGEDHPGFALGLDAWGEVAIALERYDEAGAALRPALRIYEEAGHERYARALLLQLLSMSGPTGSLSKARMPGPLASQLMRELSARQIRSAPAATRRVIEAIEEAADDESARLGAYLKLQQDGRRERAHEAWEAALTRIRAVGVARGDEVLQLRAELGLGLCLEDAGRLPEAAPWYAFATARADRIGDESMRSMTHRNAGLFHVHGGDRAIGMRHLRTAVLAAPASTDQGARSRIALAIRVQHAGSLDEARTLLQQGLDGLDPSDPEALAGRAHLEAVEHARPCGCDDPALVIAEEVEKRLHVLLPPTLAAVLTVARNGLDLVASRALTPAEARVAEDAMLVARQDVVKRIRAQDAS